MAVNLGQEVEVIYVEITNRGDCCGKILMPQSHSAESTAERGRIDHLCSVRESFLVILAITTTMTINSNSNLLICVTSAGQHESFEHVQNFRVPNANTFPSLYPVRIIFIPAYAH